MRILSVDDDEMIGELLEAALISIGHDDVQLAHSGREALDLCKAGGTAFDCILLDIQMPGMSGIDVCAELRRMPGYETTPILMLTSMTDREYVEAAYAAGANDYLNKPFDTFELSGRMRAAAATNAQQSRIDEANAQIAVMEEEIGELTQLDYDTPLVFPGVPGMIEKAALENVLLRMSRSESASCAAAAFKLDQFAEMHANHTAREVVERLTRVARGLASAFRAERVRLAYIGSGVFVCVSDRGFRYKSEEMIRRACKRIDYARDDGGAEIAAMSLSVGRSGETKLGPGLFSVSDRSASVIDLALWNLEIEPTALSPAALDEFAPVRRIMH